MKIINLTPTYQYIFDNGKVVKKELSKEKGIITSYLHPKNLFSITKKFEPHLSEEEILLEMEKYIYSYPGIDINKEYKSIFIKNIRENSIIIEAILIDTKTLEKNFKDLLKIYKYIDFISPSFLTWEEYYNLTKTEPKNDIFIYFGEKEAFLCGYSEGKYLYHKSLNKLQTLSKLLNKNQNETVEILAKKGLDISQYKNEEEFSVIDKFFSEFFLKVFNIINFSLNEYLIPKFDRIIFYSPFEIKNLFEQYENYWNLNGIEFKKSALSTEYNHLEYLITLFNAKNYDNEAVNLTIFSRPPSFLSTKTGKFFLSVFIGVLSVLGYFLFESYNLSNKQKELNALEKKYLIMKKRYNLEIKVLDKYKKENKILKSKIENLSNSIDNLTSKIDILYQKAKTPLTYNLMAKIAKSMKKYSLKAENIIKENNKITIFIVSNYDNTKEITYFMNDLMNYGFKNVKSTFISKREKNYISKVDFEDE